MKLVDILEQLEDNFNGNRDVVRLMTHKKMAILFAIPNLPGVTSDAFTVSNIRKGFIYNGQLDPDTTSVPSFQNLISAYCGDVEDTILNDRTKLMDLFFEEMFLTRAILESTFDYHKIPMDTDSKGNVIVRNNEMSLENHHWAKILSSNVQIQERRKLVNSKQLAEYNTCHKLHNSEDKEYVTNLHCEDKLLQIIKKTNQNLPIPPNETIKFNHVHDYLTLSLLSQNINY